MGPGAPSPGRRLSRRRFAEAEEAALDALRSGYSVEESFQAGRSAYFNAIDDSGLPSRRRRTDSQNMPEDAHDTG